MKHKDSNVAVSMTFSKRSTQLDFPTGHHRLYTVAAVSNAGKDHRERI